MMIDIDQFFVEALITVGLWLRSALVATGTLFIARQFPRFATRPYEAAFFAVLLATLQLAAFPPMRTQGDWRNRESGELAGVLKSRELDQFAFGIPPYYQWPGVSARYVSPLEAIDVDLSETYTAAAFDQRIDFIDMAVEMGLLGVLMTLANFHARRTVRALIARSNKT